MTRRSRAKKKRIGEGKQEIDPILSGPALRPLGTVGRRLGFRRLGSRRDKAAKPENLRA